jgi:hypothetical protein
MTPVQADVHITHRDHIVDLGYAQPVQHIGHESLEPHVLHPGNEFRGLKVLVSRVSPAFSQVVNQISLNESSSSM